MNGRFEIFDRPLRDLKIIERKPIGDHRGYIERLFCAADMRLLTSGKCIAQINRTLTARCGTVRGLHFQYPPYAEIKFVSCIRGKVFDVAVDLRQGSSTFLQWHAEILSVDNNLTLVIPEGFAHGFQTMQDDCEMFYLHTSPYQPSHEGGLNAKDPRLDICWPHEISEWSERDASRAFLIADFVGLSI